jgi:general secretion pathway protein G
MTQSAHKKTMPTKKHPKAFTLIELLIVIAIIGLLTAIVMTNLTTAKSKSRDAKRVSDVAQLQLSLELCFDRANAYPATLTLTLPCGSTTFGSFLASIPVGPTPGSNYAYTVASIAGGTNNDYVIMVPLENSNSVALTDDVDGTIFGSVDCTDPNYCVMPR